MTTYKTTDFYLACYLRAVGYTYSGLEYLKEERKAIFLFEGVNQQDVLAYYNKTEGSRVPFLDAVHAIKNTKELLYNLPRQ